MIKVKNLIRKRESGCMCSSFEAFISSNYGITLSLKNRPKKHCKETRYITLRNKMKFLMPLRKTGEWVEFSISYHKYFVNNTKLMVIFANNSGKVVFETTHFKNKSIFYRTKFRPKYTKGGR